MGVLSCLLGFLVGGTLGQFWTWLCAQTQVEGSSAFWLQAFFVSLSLCLSLSKKTVPAKLRLILDSAAVVILHIIVHFSLGFFLCITRKKDQIKLNENP